MTTFIDTHLMELLADLVVRFVEFGYCLTVLSRPPLSPLFALPQRGPACMVFTLNLCVF